MARQGSALQITTIGSLPFLEAARYTICPQTFRGCRIAMVSPVDSENILVTGSNLF